MAIKHLEIHASVEAHALYEFLSKKLGFRISKDKATKLYQTGERDDDGFVLTLTFKPGTGLYSEYKMYEHHLPFNLLADEQGKTFRARQTLDKFVKNLKAASARLDSDLDALDQYLKNNA